MIELISLWLITCIAYILSLKFGGRLCNSDDYDLPYPRDSSQRNFTCKSLLWCFTFIFPIVNILITLIFIIDLVWTFLSYRVSWNVVNKLLNKKIF